MKKLVIMLSITLVLILLGLHCFALHKRIQYLEEEIVSMHDERIRLIDGFKITIDEVISTRSNNEKGNK